MKGPNGIGFFRSVNLNKIPIPPTNAPNKVAKKKESKNTFVPTTKPTKANSLISPPPMPPLLTIAMRNKRKKAITPPRRESHHGLRGSMSRSNKKIPANTSKTLSGISIYVISETKIIMKREINVQATISSNVQPNRSGAETNNSPVISSTIG